jgi:hypothetical protein
MVLNWLGLVLNSRKLSFSNISSWEDMLNSKNRLSKGWRLRPTCILVLLLVRIVELLQVGATYFPCKLIIFKIEIVRSSNVFFCTVSIEIGIGFTFVILKTLFLEEPR